MFWSSCHWHFIFTSSIVLILPDISLFLFGTWWCRAPKDLKGISDVREGRRGTKSSRKRLIGMKGLVQHLDRWDELWIVLKETHKSTCKGALQPGRHVSYEEKPKVSKSSIASGDRVGHIASFLRILWIPLCRRTPTMKFDLNCRQQIQLKCRIKCTPLRVVERRLNWIKLQGRKRATKRLNQRSIICRTRRFEIGGPSTLISDFSSKKASQWYILEKERTWSC